MNSACPHCGSINIVRNGFSAPRIDDGACIQRYKCKCCKRQFSDATFSITYRQKRRMLNDAIFRMLLSGVSERRTAIALGCSRETVAYRIDWGGFKAQLDMRHSKNKDLDGTSSSTS